MTTKKPTIIYTLTDEAPMLATWAFLPIIRTFAPFVAGVAKMPYPRFFGFSVFGTVLWVGGLVTLGYFFGNVPFIKKNLSLLVVGIILLSLVPMIIGVVRSRFGSTKAQSH